MIFFKKIVKPIIAGSLVYRVRKHNQKAGKREKILDFEQGTFCGIFLKPGGILPMFSAS